MLPRGITGFYSQDEPTPPTIDRRRILSAIHHALRTTKARPDTTPSRQKTVRNYFQFDVSLDDQSSVGVVVNHHFPYVAFSAAKRLPLSFVAAPQFAGALTAFDDELRVMAPQDLNRPISTTDLKDLASAELDQISYWKPATIGEVMFNTWD